MVVARERSIPLWMLRSSGVTWLRPRSGRALALPSRGFLPRGLLPGGRGLPDDVWAHRHRGIRMLLWAHVPALGLFGVVMGYRGVHAGLHLAPLVLFAFLSGRQGLPRRAQSAAAAIGLLVAAALGVHLSGGVTESHFHFFVLVVVLSLYEDWLVFLLSIGFVVLHHALASSLGLGAVYSHAGSDWPWALVHGGFVLAAAAACIVSWRLSEQLRAQLHEAEQRELESSLREAQKLESLGLLAGGVAHDFNNLLVGVLGNASLALDDLPADSRVRANVEQIELAALRAADLTKQMLAYSGNSRLVAEPLDISLLVDEMAHLLEVAVSKKATLHLQLDRRLGMVNGDRGQLSQVVMNLITNAAEAVGDGGGSIFIRTARVGPDEVASFQGVDGVPDAGSYAIVEVRDTGSGMDPETLRRIFEPFFTTKFTGRGLGLAAVCGIVRGHGGHITVESVPGEGTTFRVLLPALDQIAEPAVPIVRPVPTGRGTVLVVDDEESVRAVARGMLEHAGFDVLTAASGSDAVAALRLRHARLVAAVVDMSMPGLNGVETARALRGLDPRLPIVLSSGYTTDTVDDPPPHTRFLQKPYTMEELLELIRDAIAAPIFAGRAA